ncbi:MAG TPA: TonB family protein [Bryobacteraceae bacterium]|jgi:TonB family protein
MATLYGILTGAALKSLLVLAAAGLMAVLLRRHSAGVRHLVWTAAFAGLLALLGLMVLLPGLPVISLPQGPVFQAQAASAAAVGHAASDDCCVPSRDRQGAVHLPGLPWRKFLVWVWVAGCAFSFARMVAAWLVMLRVRWAARSLPDVDGVTVLETRPGSMPMTFGILRPAIFLPADAADWPEERRRAVLMHELAHIRRGDTTTHLVARAALALYWWNPLAWYAWRRFVRERERAADDFVLSAGARPSSYAAHLLEIARGLHATPAVGCAAVAMACRLQLEGRLLAILDSNVNRKAPRRAVGWIATLATILLIAPLAALRAQNTETVPADVAATIRAAAAQKNHQMLESAARAEEAYRKFDLARRLLDSSLAIRGEVSGQGSVEYGVGLIKIADLELSRKNFDEAQNFYAKAVSVLGNRAEAAPALIHLGLLALQRKNNEKAYDYFQQAQVADPSKAGPALMWMAIVRDRQNDTAGADSLFKQSFSVEYMGSVEAATTLEAHAAFLRRQGRNDEAKALTEHAATIRKNLPTTEFRQVAGVTPLRVGAGVMPPKLAYKVEPDYSEEARMARVEGTVIVKTTIGTDGTAQNMQVIKGLGLGLDEKALQAISQWKFNSGTKDGQPVPVMATIEVNFRLL